MKRVVVVLEIGANYVFHLAALAKAGFESDYADTYRDTVVPKDLETLVSYRDRLQFGFGSGQGGDLAGILIFEPGYLNLDSEEALRDYFELLDHGFLTSDYSRFLKRFRTNPGDWVVKVDGEYLSQYAQSRDAIRELGSVYINNFDTYINRVWPLESMKMESVAARLNEHFRAFDVIGKWEEVTGCTFRYDEYRIVLCSALKNGPTANSLGYNKNTFYHGHDLEWMKDLISHEVGTHIMIDVYKELIRTGAYPSYLAYRAFENLARFYNLRVLDSRRLYKLGPNYHEEEFEQVYSEVLGKCPALSPFDVARRGLDLFLERYPHLS